MMKKVFDHDVSAAVAAYDGLAAQGKVENIALSDIATICSKLDGMKAVMAGVKLGYMLAGNPNDYRITRARHPLSELMDQRGVSQSALADAINISRQTLSASMNFRREFTQEEISRISSYLKLTRKEIRQVFFPDDAPDAQDDDDNVVILNDWIGGH